MRFAVSACMVRMNWRNEFESHTEHRPENIKSESSDLRSVLRSIFTDRFMAGSMPPGRICLMKTGSGERQSGLV